MTCLSDAEWIAAVEDFREQLAGCLKITKACGVVRVLECSSTEATMRAEKEIDRGGQIVLAGLVQVLKRERADYAVSPVVYFDRELIARLGCARTTAAWVARSWSL